MDEQQRISDVASSSNSSSPVSSKKYDVFLSFRGEDTRMNFTSHLYNVLTEAKIKTFIDNLLQKGDEISPALIKAIEDSHISIVIFSEKYASSKWCLNELSKILEVRKEKGQIVIPIFYNIDPSDVRKQTGNYEQAFADHEREPMCNKWKAALTEAANLAGWDSQNRIESELLKDILQDVLQKLAHTCQDQHKRLVGIEKNYEEIESMLNIRSTEVIKTLGIWGMGGIGKTTLATALYDKLSHKFEGRCFLTNVREKSDKLEDLCCDLFSKLLGNKTHGFDNFDMSRLRRKKVFIVLDDVSTSEQLEKLIAEYDFLGAGSRVIVTTRDKQILSTFNEIYSVEELNSHHSLELFCLTIFGEKQPKQGYEHLSRRVIAYCKGVPLALKVLGASLRKRSKEAWECELRKLEKIPNMKIHNVLKLSYDDLDRSEKNIFLDIACFFKGGERDWVTKLLETFDFFPASGIEVLLDKALITISDTNEIEMHDLIQEMGREIVHQESEKYPGKRSRLWKSEEVLDILKYNKGTDVIEGIILDLDTLNGDLYLCSNSLAKMTNMRFLKIHTWFWHGKKFNVYFNNGLESLSDKLRCLYWDGYCLESLPSNFCAEQLVEIRMCNSNVKKLWDGVQNLVNLKTINLAFSTKLIEIPNLSKAENLEIVNLNHCESLRRLHPCVLSLPKLIYLFLSCCRKIESLKSNLHSKSLCVLTMGGCSLLKEFLVTSEKIISLDLSYTAICALSSSIGHLSSLEMLDISGTNVESLPANIKNLSMLVKVVIADCRKLVSLPELPPSLRKLCLDDCWNLVSLPELPPLVKKVRAFNCISLETDIIEDLVLQHMLQSCIPYLHEQYLNDPKFCGHNYFVFPRDHVTNECGFHTADSLITISNLPKSDLFGFICYIILSKGPDLDVSDDEDDKKLEVYVCIYIYQDGIQVGRVKMSMFPHIDLISNNVVFFYVDIKEFDTIREVYDQFVNITFIFELKYWNVMIEGCGVFPVYATTSGLKLVNSSTKVGHDQERIKQCGLFPVSLSEYLVNSSSFDNESQARAIGVGCSNNENEDDWEQLFPASKRQRMPS